MNRSLFRMSVVPLLLALAAMLALSACSSNVKSQAAEKAKAAGKFDLTLKAYKSGQFLLDGAIVSSLDLNSHFAYLQDQHKLPKTVLLERSEKSKIHKEHLRYMAAMAYTYGFTVVYDKSGKLRRIVPTSKDKNVKLRTSPKNNDNSHPELDRNSAAGNRHQY